MLTQTMVKLFTLLMIPLAVFAAPNVAMSKHFDQPPFAPGTREQGGFNRCSSEEHHKDNLTYPADMLDCLEISRWASEHNGIWILKATTNADDEDDWHVLRAQGNCALFVKNTAPTSIGNKDIADLIEAVHLEDGLELGPVDELGTFCGCQAGVDVDFWLRSPESLEY
ncbi:hypothetical protein F5Y07DRAFT_5479 [Xylaria sp. FL0933]|nr:hypothetical protein F5Y07DRAFT_5479 [Xylaria sp. FL0933]